MYIIVGSNNHRQFVCFLISMTVGIIVFDKLTVDCKSYS